MNMMRPMRRTSLIGPWGVGSIVPFPNDETLMIAGLDMWRYNNAENFIIKDERLINRIDVVKELRWPPDFRDKKADPEDYNLTVPAVRFPTWYYCPFCGSMRKTSYYETQPTCDAYQWELGRKCSLKSKYKKKMIPERFIVICPEGHIDDFPVAEWLHHNTGHQYNSDTCRIRRSTGGVSSSLSGVSYECTCGAKKSLSGATNKGAMARIQYQCKASRPWLGISEDKDNPCKSSPEDLRVVLRGATNVWFAETVSSLYIPTNGDETDKKIINIVDRNFDYINSSRVNGELNREIIKFLANQNKVDFERLYSAFLKKCAGEEEKLVVNKNTSEEEYRYYEYKVLIKTSGNDSQEFHSINHPISEYNSIISNYFKSISLVPKLRETRAFVGFSRLKPQNQKYEESVKNLRLGSGNWLPAIETYGEGIFFEFDELRLTEWAKKPEVIKRIKCMEESYKNSYFSRGFNGRLRPEFVLIHTFSHLIINQLSFECGYGSSSIRERIYCEKGSNDYHMCGVLIYTASGDSEGSLGGLVRQGEKGRIEDTIVSALKNALWCTSDPVCIQSLGQGTDSCNLAACHSCALLPETCCETDIGNRLLDRGVVIGTIDKPDLGYFSDIRNL